MVTIIFALFCALLSSASAAELQQIEGVSGDVYMIRFDSEYTYAVSSGPIGYPLFSKFYKINSEKKLVWATHWDGETQNIRINKQNDIYSIVGLPPNETTVNILRSGSKTFEEIDRVAYPIYDFMDNEENLFYSTGSGGIRMIRFNETTPVDIANTENFQVYEHSRYTNMVSADKDGNIYFGGCINGGDNCKNETREFQLIVITAEEKRKEIPTAQVIDNVLQDPKNDYVIQILASKRDDVLISTLNEITEIGNIETLKNGNVTVLLSESGQHFGKEAGDRIIYHMLKRDPIVIISCGVSYLTLDDELLPVSNLQEILNEFACPVRISDPDEDGNLFIGGGVELDTSSVEFLNHTKSETVGVKFEGDFGTPFGMTMDRNGSLWLLDGWGDVVFYVKSGTLNGVQVSNGDVPYLWNIKSNHYNDEIFLYGLNGLYVIVP